MRQTILAFAVVSLIAFAGCRSRDTVNVVPDRQGAALQVGPPSVGGGAYVLVAGPGEAYYPLKDGEQNKLAEVAKKNGTTLEWLIQRNDLGPERIARLSPGTNLIVPKK